MKKPHALKTLLFKTDRSVLNDGGPSNDHIVIFPRFLVRPAPENSHPSP